VVCVGLGDAGCSRVSDEDLFERGARAWQRGFAGQLDVVDKSVIDRVGVICADDADEALVRVAVFAEPRERCPPRDYPAILAARKRRLVAAPPPLVGMCAQTGADGIPERVPDDDPELDRTADQHASEASLKDVANAVMTGVERARIPPVRETHATRQARPRRTHNNVIVVAHQAVREEFPVVALNDASKPVEEVSSVLIVAIDRVAFNSARHDVVDRAGDVRSMRTCHIPLRANAAGSRPPLPILCVSDADRLTPGRLTLTRVAPTIRADINQRGEVTQPLTPQGESLQLYEMVIVRDTSTMRQHGLAGRTGAVLGISRPDTPGGHTKYAVGAFDFDETTMFSEEELASTGRIENGETFRSGESIRVSRQGEPLEP
jgi:hypothetical protein